MDSIVNDTATRFVKRGEGPDPRDDQAVGVDRGGRVGGDGDLGTDALEGTLGRAQVAGAVVEDGDAR